MSCPHLMMVIGGPLYFHGGVYVLGTASQAYSPVLDEAAAAPDRAGRLLSSYLASSERVSA